MGRIMAHLVTQVVRDTRAAMAPVESEHKRRALESMLDDWEVKLGERMVEVLASAGDESDPDAFMSKVLEIMGQPKNQIDILIQILLFIPFALSVGGTWGSVAFRGVTQLLQSKYANVPLSPADAADAVIRSIIDQGQGEGQASLSGVGAQTFDQLVQLTGEVPPLDEMRTLLIQGRISEIDFERIFKYSRVRNEWLNNYTEAHYKPLSGADIVEGFVKGHLDHSEAQARFGVGGGMPDEFDLAVAIAGNPIGVEQALALFNHGLIDEDQARSVIKASRINPRFEDMALLTRFHYLSVFQIERMLTQGTVSHEDAARWLQEEGLPADQVAGLIKGAATTKATKAKQASESLVLDNYEAGFITNAQAVDQLGNLGYHPDEAAIIIESYDARRVLMLRNHGVTATGKAYKAGVIDKQTASSDLDALGVSSTLRDHYLALWEVERKTDFKEFTRAEIGSMFKKGIISESFAVDQWQSMGYTSAQAMLLLFEYGKPLPGNGPIV